MPFQPVQALAILAMVLFALYRQTRQAPVTHGLSSYKIPIIYAVAGYVSMPSQGWTPPQGIGWAFLIGGIALGGLVGLIRGLATKVWVDPDGIWMRQGTWVTVILFLGLVATKTALGFLAGFSGIHDGASFGEVLVVIAVMAAAQVWIISTRQLRLQNIRSSSPQYR